VKGEEGRETGSMRAWGEEKKGCGDVVKGFKRIEDD